MSHQQLELAMQKETQKAIAILQQNMNHLNQVLQIIDGNMRQSHAVMFQELDKTNIRLNFIVNEMSSKLTSEEKEDLENRFKEFSRIENEKRNEQIKQARENFEKMQAEAAAKKAEENSNGGKNVIL